MLIKKEVNPFAKQFWAFWPEELYHKPVLGEKKNYAFLGFFIVVLIASVANLLFINNELWQDELYTLDHFVLVPIGTTLTDYHSSNNHIVFSLIANIYLKARGVNSLGQILNDPIIIRILPYLFTLLSVASFYLLSKKIFGSLLTTIASIVFLTSLQTYSFGTQVRGYALEVLLCTLHFLLILRYKQTGNNKLLFFILVIGTLELVNLPSTLYLYGAIILLLVISLIVDPEIRIASQALKSASGKLLLTLICGLLIALSFFINKLPQLQINSAEPFKNSLFTLIKHPFAVFFYFVDFRYIILIPPILTFLILYRKKSNYKLSIFLAGSFFIPFLFFAIHNPYLIHRIWIVLLPVFSLLIAQFSIPFFTAYKRFLVPYAILNVFALVVSLILLKKSISFDDSRSRVRLDLRYQYHLFGFNPGRVLNQAVVTSAKEGAKIEIMERSIGGIRFYAQSLNIDSINLGNKYSNKIILITDSTHIPEKFGGIGYKVIRYGTTNNEKYYKWFLLDESSRR
jgi:hypothetical protein